MNHRNEEEMILHFYGEDDAAAHLRECAECGARFAALRALLESVDGMRVPERGEDYGARVWRRIEGRVLPRRQWRAWAAIAAMLAVGLAGFLLGRRSTSQPELADVRSKVLVVALTGHLERSQMVMKELSNAADGMDFERAEASDLLESNRLYRQSAAQQGDTQTVVLLEDLERLLLEIAHSPDRMGAAELDEFRRRIEEQAFRVKVLSSRIGRQQQQPQQSETRGNKL